MSAPPPSFTSSGVRGRRGARAAYWTMTFPFMFIARCGVQWKS